VTKPPHGPHELYGHPVPPRQISPEEYQQIVQRWHARRDPYGGADVKAGLCRQIEQAHEIIASATGLRRQILALHWPELVVYPAYYGDHRCQLECTGCEWSGPDDHSPPWPCTTWDLAVEHPG
jgi:hypothetical protein